jgi:hypothetical protein
VSFRWYVMRLLSPDGSLIRLGITRLTIALNQVHCVDIAIPENAMQP